MAKWWCLRAHEQESRSGSWVEGNSRGPVVMTGIWIWLHNMARLWDHLASALESWWKVLKLKSTKWKKFLFPFFKGPFIFTQRDLQWAPDLKPFDDWAAQQMSRLANSDGFWLAVSLPVEAIWQGCLWWCLTLLFSQLCWGIGPINLIIVLLLELRRPLKYYFLLN